MELTILIDLTILSSCHCCSAICPEERGCAEWQEQATCDRGGSVRDRRSVYGTGLLRTGMHDQDVLQDAQDQD